MTRDDTHVEVAHDALFRTWPRLETWRSDAGQSLAHQRDVKREFLTETPISEGGQLENAVRLKNSGLLSNDSPLLEFIAKSEASAKAAKSQRDFWRRAGQIGGVAAAVAFFIASALFIFALRQTTAALDQRDLAISREAIRLAGLSRNELEEKNNPLAAIELALEAVPAELQHRSAAQGLFAGISGYFGWTRDLFG